MRLIAFFVLVCFSSLGADTIYWTFHNDSPTNHYYQVEYCWDNDGSWAQAWSASVVANGTGTWDQSFNNPGFQMCTRVSWKVSGGTWGGYQTFTPVMSTGSSSNRYDAYYSGGAPAPIYYQVWSGFFFTNTTADTMELTFGYTGSSSNGNGTVGPVLWLHPGEDMNGIMWTNLGTGAHGALYDQNGNIVWDMSGGTQYSGGNPSSGSGGSAHQNPVVPTVGGAHGGSGGSTNSGASQADIYNLGATLTEGLRNVASAVRGVGTNISQLPGGTGTNSLADATNNVMSKYSFASSATNATAALAAGSAEFSSTGGNFDTAIEHGEVSGLGLAAEGTGSAATMKFQFCGQQIDLDPEATFPGMMAIVKAGWTFVLLVGFSLTTGKLFFEVSKTFSRAQTGGVPDLNATFAGIGGNFLGVIVYGLCVIALIAVWVWVFNQLFTSVLSSLGLLPDASAAFSFGGNAIALYLLHSAFPVSLFLTLLGTRISLQWSAGKVVGIAAAASRFLIHK